MNQTQALAKHLEVEVTESAMKGFLATVGRQPPETIGIFAGDLDRPNRLVEFRYCPPRRARNGSFDRSGVHINVDAQYMNFVIDEEWRPQGLDLLGIGHSHPGGCRQLTYGDEGANEGDIVFLKSCLRNDDSPGRKWKVCYAPIITFEPAGKPLVDWYAVTLEDPEPLPVVPKRVPDDRPIDPLALPMYSADVLEGRYRAYEARISAIRNGSYLGKAEKDLIIGELRLLLQHDLKWLTRAMIAASPLPSLWKASRHRRSQVHDGGPPAVGTTGANATRAKARLLRAVTRRAGSLEPVKCLPSSADEGDVEHGKVIGGKDMETDYGL